MKRKMLCICLALALLVTAALPGALPAVRAQAADGDFVLGAGSSDMLAGGGRWASAENGDCWLDDAGRLWYAGALLADGPFACLNALGETAWCFRPLEDGASLVRLDLNTGEEAELTRLDTLPAQLYVLNGADFFYRAGEQVFCLHGKTGETEQLVSQTDLCGFAPTPVGLVIAVGSLFHYDVYLHDTLLAKDADGWYTEPGPDGWRLVYTRDGETWQVGLAAAVEGTVFTEPYAGLPTEAAAPTEDAAPVEIDEPEAPVSVTRRQVLGEIHRKTLSQGVQNIVKRAYQMTDIQWTPVANITGWGGGLTYQAGTTYTGLPYGQPVNASYVPWSTDLTDFIAKVNDPTSKMYTSQSTYNKVAPYYSCDCSAFVSWAWNLSARQTTSSIASYATTISGATVSNFQVGDALNNAGSHVVLITDITYDTNGAINGVEISESTVVRATNYCCQKTWYGTGHAYTLANLKTKYLDAGYGLLRSKTRDNASYAHVCVSPVAGDVCTLCGYGTYAGVPVAATVNVPAAATTYTAPGGATSGTVSAGEQSILASTTVDGTVWYQLASGAWIPADSAAFVHYDTSVQIANKSFPSGRLEQGKSFPIVGNVTTVNPMTSIRAAIYSGNTTSGTPVLTKTVTLSSATAYTLRSSAIDNAMTFGSLAAGQYTFLLEITEQATCAGQSTQSLIWRETSLFTKGPSTAAGIASACGIDVSTHQGTINWDSVAANVDFVIIRCGYGSDITSQDDAKWAENVAACERLGIPYGVYLYSYVNTEAKAHSEAAHVIRLLQGHTPSMPVYLDLEDNTVSACTKAQILSFTQIFCEDIAAAGYTPGVYANLNWWNNYLTSSTYDQWTRWVAQYSSSFSYTGSYEMWQYTDSGTVSGISGNVDMDYWYGDYPTVGGHTHTLAETAARDASCTASGNIRYWYCSGCGKYFSDAEATVEITQAQTLLPALGHDYVQTVIPATCQQYEGVLYTCSRCGDAYAEYATGDWTDWSVEAPEGIDPARIQTRTEYRYRDYETTTSYSPALSGWEQLSSAWEQSGSGHVDYVAQTWPAGYDTSHSTYTTYHVDPVAASQTETAKTEIGGSEIVGYIYWHWCRGSYTAGPINRRISTTCTSTYPAFHAFFDTKTPDDIIEAGPNADGRYYDASDDSYVNANAACCRDSYWYYAIPVTRQTYTTWQKVFTYERWTDWSDWSTEPAEASDTREVQTRTVYRYQTAVLGPHNYVNGVCTVCGDVNSALQPRVVRRSITLSGEIGVNFYLRLPEEIAADADAAFTWGEGTALQTVIGTLVPYQGSTVADANYVATCRLSAKYMADPVTLTLSANGETFLTDSYSVVQYAADAADYYQNDAALKALLCNMLDYGAAAQTFFNYQTDALASAAIEQVDANWTRPAAGPLANNTSLPNSAVLANFGLRFEYATLLATSKTAIRLYFSPLDGADVNAVAAVCGTDRLEFREKDGLVYLEIANISAKNIFDTYTVTLTAAGSSVNIVYSAADYYNRVLASEAQNMEPLKAVLRAMYNYSASADAYLTP